MCGAISEGGTIFLHSMKLVSLEDLGFREPKVLKYHRLATEAPFSYLLLGDALEVSVTDSKKEEEEEEEEAPSISSKKIMCFINTLEHVLIFLKCMIIEHAFMNLVTPGKNNSLGLAK
jgi:hypothetical protein